MFKHKKCKQTILISEISAFFMTPPQFILIEQIIDEYANSSKIS